MYSYFMYESIHHHSSYYFHQMIWLCFKMMERPLQSQFVPFDIFNSGIFQQDDISLRYKKSNQKYSMVIARGFLVNLPFKSSYLPLILGNYYLCLKNIRVLKMSHDNRIYNMLRYCPIIHSFSHRKFIA